MTRTTKHSVQQQTHNPLSDKAFLSAVFSYYDKHGRHDLPWRSFKATPYHIVVSEIMLQQTQVPRVIPKYHDWLRVYPTLRKLSQASLSDVLSLWQGLGYQRRAKSLLALARTCTRLPKTYEELRALPGIGPYTATAVCAFAYDTFCLPMIETNIRAAVIHTFFQGRELVSDKEIQQIVQRLTDRADVRKRGARYVYSALMDYGAMIKKSVATYTGESAAFVRQTPFRGSRRELRARLLVAVREGVSLSHDDRTEGVLHELEREGFIEKSRDTWSITK